MLRKVRRKIMGYTGINLGNVRIENRSAILKLLNDQGAMSRKDIALALGLTPATVTLICTELLSAGLLYEKGEAEEEKRAGRKKVLIDINYQYRFVLCISIEPEDTCITISDLKGAVTASQTLKTDGSRRPEQFLEDVAEKAKVLLWENSIPKDAILGVGVSAPGTVRRETGVSQHAYRIWNEPVPVGEILRQYLGYPVIVENNVKAFAEGELIYGSGRQRENLLFIKWGPGVGSAIIIQSRIYDSQNSKTAEIGHYIVEKNGKPCRCGRKGCLETLVSTHAVAERVRAACTPEAMPQLYQMLEGDVSRITARSIQQWAGGQDPGLLQVLDEAADTMAQIVTNTITLLAPDQVIIYGYMFDLPPIQDSFLRCCTRYDPAYNGTYIQKSSLSGKLEYIGPLAVVMNELFLMYGAKEEL